MSKKAKSWQFDSVFDHIMKIIQNLVFSLIRRLKYKPFVYAFNFYIRFLTYDKFKLRAKYLGKNIYYLTDNASEIYLQEPFRFISFLTSIKFRLEKLADEYFLQDINLKNNDTVLDCGANVGEFYLCLTNIVNDINYISFEPSELDFKILNLNAPNGQNNKIALSDTNDSTMLFVNTKKADSSINYIPNSTHTEKVKICRLDTFLVEDQKRIALFKLEAEGHELEVLKGSINTLKRIDFISADLGSEKYNETEKIFENTFKETNLFLMDNNFELIKKNKYRDTYLYRNKSLEI